MLNLSDKECMNILCTALEGGCGYWMNESYLVKVFLLSPAEQAKQEFPEIQNYSGFHIKLRKSSDDQDVLRNVIGLGDIAKAAEDIISGKANVGSGIIGMIAAERDACDVWGADAIVQIAVFGTLVYG